MARRQVKDLTSVAENIYRGTLNIEDKVAGVYYFDLNRRVPENFEDYQEELLSDEFYNNPGSRQWNYYLFMLNEGMSPERKRSIERDDRYARKFVLSEGEFERFFESSEGGEGVQTSVVNTWKETLDAADLQEVYGGESYVDIFERFCANNTRKGKSESRKGPLSDAGRVSFVDRILMKEDYRRYPKEAREIRFGKVNLVQGINGVGKTSTFEAIELVLCGATFRNKEQTNKDGCVEAELNGNGTVIRYQSKNTALYQSRDLSWYSNTNSRGNTLYNSFNRFNYFNADAAQQFASGGSSEDEIRNALFNIVLGPEYTYIQERSVKMLSRISPAYKKLDTELVQMRRQLQVADQVIGRYEQPENLQAMTQNINSLASGIGFVLGDFDFQAQSALLEQENNRLQVVLAHFTADGFATDTLDAHRAKLRVFDEKQKVFSGLIEQVKAYNFSLGDFQKNIRRLESDRDLLSRALGYFQDSRFLELRDLEERTKDNSFRVQKIRFLVRALGNQGAGDLGSSLGIAVFLEQLGGELKTRELERSRLNHRIEDAIRKLGRIEGLVKEIKLAGSQYLELDLDSCTCPMCQSSFERGVLEERLRQAGSEGTGGDGALQLEASRAALNKINEEIIDFNKQIALVENIKNAYQTYFERQSDLSVSQTVAALEEEISLLTKLENEHKRLQAVADFGRLSGKSEKELRSIESQLESVLGRETVLEAGGEALLRERREAIEKTITVSDSLRKDTMRERYEIGLKIKELLGYPAEEQVEVKVAEEELHKESARLDAFSRYFGELVSIMSLGETASVTALKASSDLLKENIGSHREAAKAEVEVNAAKNYKKESEQFIQDNRIKHERLQKAYDTLTALAKNEESQEQLKEFFDQNFREINDIFMSIHMPREFTGLKFDGKTIRLRDEYGANRTVNEISTGQRSALALSIFLSLNRKLTNGPDLIMFDDPVAFIDDFNVLSFLDYLRNNVLTTGKQIFFATANARLAGLFEKKFSFLGEGGYVNIPLDR